jgi:hypothetical protein
LDRTFEKAFARSGSSSAGSEPGTARNDEKFLRCGTVAVRGIDEQNNYHYVHVRNTTHVCPQVFPSVGNNDIASLKMTWSVLECELDFLLNRVLEVPDIFVEAISTGKMRLGGSLSAKQLSRMT